MARIATGLAAGLVLLGASCGEDVAAPTIPPTAAPTTTVQDLPDPAAGEPSSTIVDEALGVRRAALPVDRAYLDEEGTLVVEFSGAPGGPWPCGARYAVEGRSDAEDRFAVSVVETWRGPGGDCPAIAKLYAMPVVDGFEGDSLVDEATGRTVDVVPIGAVLDPLWPPIDDPDACDSVTVPC